VPGSVAERHRATSVLGGLLVQPLQARDPAQVREHPHLLGGIATPPVRVEGRRDAVPRRGPVGCRDRRQRALEQHPVQAEEVTGPPGERLQLLDDAAQPGDLAEVGVGGLEAVEADDQRGVLARGATGRGGAASVVARLANDSRCVASTARRASASASAARSPRAAAIRRQERSGGTHSATGDPAPTTASPPSSRNATISSLRSPASRAAASAARWSSRASAQRSRASRADRGR
jgi:hypothetical protein